MDVQDLSSDEDEADVTIGPTDHDQHQLDDEVDSPLKHLDHVQQFSDCEILDQEEDTQEDEVCRTPDFYHLEV